MTDKKLKSLIDKLNRGSANELIHLRPLSRSVDFAKVWYKLPKIKERISDSNKPDKFYFIKNEMGLYVATIADMVEKKDLHWFVDRKYRKKGYLTRAMRQTVLPHLFQDRDQQRITIDEIQIGPKNYLASRAVALKLGFVEGENLGEYFLALESDVEVPYFPGENKVFSYERLQELKNHMKYLGQSLSLIHSEIEMSLGESEFSDELMEKANEISSYVSKLESTYWACKKEIR